MEQCVSRLDVAMFNAILRESAEEIPTDPVSDPIIDSKVLPIPAGDLSFGSGAQLKNSVCAIFYSLLSKIQIYLNFNFTWPVLSEEVSGEYRLSLDILIL